MEIGGGEGVPQAWVDLWAKAGSVHKRDGLEKVLDSWFRRSELQPFE